MKNEVNCWKPSCAQQHNGNQQPSPDIMSGKVQRLSRKGSTLTKCRWKCLTPYSLEMKNGDDIVHPGWKHRDYV